MSIRKILLPLTGTAGGEATLGTALVAAAAWNAHVSAVHVRVDPRDVAPLAGEGLSGAMVEEMMEATEKEGDVRAREVLALFERVVTARNVTVAKARAGAEAPTASFDTVVGREEEVVAHQARLADLTVVAHPGVDDDVASADALHAVLFDSGRAVLLAPATAPDAIGTRVALAWNGTAESAAAVQAVLPWLKRASAVRILQGESYQRRGPAAADLAIYLALHGVEAEIANVQDSDHSVGAGLLAAAAAFGADLLAMGAYSHSRLRQLILGGVTRHVLENAALPVLMKR